MKLDEFAALVERSTPGPWVSEADEECQDLFAVNREDGGVIGDFLGKSNADYIAASRVMSEKLIAVARAASKLEFPLTKVCNGITISGKDWVVLKEASRELASALKALEASE